MPSDTVADDVDKQALLESLQQSLLQAENDPEKSLEIRRRIQLLKEQQTPETTVASNSQE